MQRLPNPRATTTEQFKIPDEVQNLSKGEGIEQEVFRQTLATGAVVGWHGLFAAVVDAEAGVSLGEEVGEFSVADELGIVEVRGGK